MPLEKLADALAIKSTVLYVLGHSLDLITTYLLTPDLEKETNVMVAKFGLGWTYILVSAAASSLIALAALLWMWRRLIERLPRNRTGYKQLYRSILLGSTAAKPRGMKLIATGTLIGLVCIIAYALITAKLLTCIWNLNVLFSGLAFQEFALMILAKNGLAAGVGLFMFFVYPYWLQRAALRA